MVFWHRGQSGCHNVDNTHRLPGSVREHIVKRLAVTFHRNLRCFYGRLSCISCRQKPFPWCVSIHVSLVLHDIPHNRTTCGLQRVVRISEVSGSCQHDLQHGDLMETCAFKTCLLDLVRSDLTRAYQTHHMIQIVE